MTTSLKIFLKPTFQPECPGLHQGKKIKYNEKIFKDVALLLLVCEVPAFPKGNPNVHILTEGWMTTTSVSTVHTRQLVQPF